MTRSRRLTGLRAALVLALPMGLLFACSGSTSPPPPDVESDSVGAGEMPSSVNVARVTATLPRLDSVLPARLLPSDGAVDLLSNSPGVAVASIVAEDALPHAVGWSDHVTYFLGQDGDWRRLKHTDLGLPASEWAGWDGYGLGHLSSDGRNWIIGTKSGFAIVSLRDGKVRQYRWQGNGMLPAVYWESRQQLLVGKFGLGYWTVDSRDLSDRKISRPGWKTMLLDDAGQRLYFNVARNSATRVTLVPPTGGGGQLLGDLPFEVARGVRCGDRFLAFDDAAVSGAERSTVWLVSSEDLQNQAQLLWPRRYPDDSIFGCSHSGTALLQYGRQIVAWKPEEEVVRRVSSVPSGWYVDIATESGLVR